MVGQKSQKGANVNIREITLVKAQDCYKQKRENRSSLFVDQPGLEICCYDATHRADVCCRLRRCKR